MKNTTLMSLLCSTVLGTVCAHAQTYKVLHTFVGASDHATPSASLIANSAGTVLYGVTSDAGTEDSPQTVFGSVFKFNISTNNLSTVYAFKGSYGLDGQGPAAPLTLASSILYGSTQGLPSDGNYQILPGTIFKIDPSTGVETSILGLGYNNDDDPIEGPYLATASLVTLTGAKKYVQFPIADYPSSDGYQGSVTYAPINTQNPLQAQEFANTAVLYPESNLIPLSDGFYMGTSVSDLSNSSGTIYITNPTSMYTTTSYLFTGNLSGSTDGEFPYGQLAFDGTTVYGTTYQGGKNNNSGTIWSYNTSTKVYTQLYSFPDNAPIGPAPGVTLSNGVLYGASGWLSGGLSIWKYTLSTGNYKVLFTATTLSQGSQPAGPPIVVNGTLYGVAQSGGNTMTSACRAGCGVLYSLTLPSGSKVNEDDTSEPEHVLSGPRIDLRNYDENHIVHPNLIAREVRQFMRHNH
jgi:uncharacterized repeat protein (TIGR03803 family)